MDTSGECPVCNGRVAPASALGAHMSSHSKEDILAALIRQRPASGPIPESSGIHFMAGNTFPTRFGQPLQTSMAPMMSTQPISLIKRNNTNTNTNMVQGSIGHIPQTFDMNMSQSANSMGSYIMPQMLGMMQVMSPCFIPQQNGPPLLVNMPSYIYPNVGIMGGMLSASSNVTPSTSGQSVMTSTPGGFSFASAASSTTSTLQQIILSNDPISFGGTSAVQQQTTNTTTNSSTGGGTTIVVQSPSSSPNDTSSVIMDIASSSDDSVISVDDHKPLKFKSSVFMPDLEAGTSTRSTRNDEDSNSEPPNSSNLKRESSNPNREGETEAQGIFGFTRYASDSPYPAASINITSSMLNIEEQLRTRASCSGDIQVEVEVKEISGFIEDEQESSTGSSSGDSTNQSSYDAGHTVCSVQTVTDLQNALKCEDDIQIVVPNELLETIEFKTFLSNLGSFPITSNTMLDAETLKQEACAAPPNTPAVTRPPSICGSPQPCSSRDLTESSYIVPNHISSHSNSEDSDQDDDITLQDLVALETMEDADDDQFFDDPLEPFMNAILRVDNEPPPPADTFSCLRCGLSFNSFVEFGQHKNICSKKRSSKGVGKKSSQKSTKKSSVPILSLDDSNANLDSSSINNKWSTIMLSDIAVKSEQSSILSTSDLLKIDSVSSTTVKFELFDSFSQPALGAAGQNHWKCNQCKLVFETGPELWVHLDLIRHAVNKCSHCHLVFDDKKQAISHRKKEHPSLVKIKIEETETLVPNVKGEFTCEICDRAFKEKDLLIKHQSCHAEEKPFECLECGKKFSKPTLLRDHRRRHFEVGAFSCTFCQKRFYTPSKLREHERIHTGEAPLSCNICGKTFRRHSNLSEHKRIHLEVRPEKPTKELFCHCGKVFPTQRDLDWHKEGEHDNIPKKCTHCGEIFIHSSSLTRHIRIKHESNFMPANKKTSLYAKCPICQQTFYKTSINKHIRIKHNGQKPYECGTCKAHFVTKCNLINHQWQHKGVRSRPFKCQLCNKAYLRKTLLDGHMRSHRGVKPFVCNECGLQFANKSNWQRHVAEHSGTRNYPCHLCDKRFSRNYYLTDHLKTHTGEKPFVCGICGKSAATRSNYNSHLRTHITREPVNSEV